LTGSGNTRKILFHFKVYVFCFSQVAFVAPAICAKWVPVSARLLRQLADMADKDVNAGKKRRAEGETIFDICFDLLV